jgi:drug/metabolite transporter (DMT)-like permease
VIRAIDVPPESEGRAARTALLGFLAAGPGSNLFDDATDPLLTTPSFVLTMLLTGALIIELTDQARRRPAGDATRWARTDTAIVVVLTGYATLLCAAAALQHLPPPEETAAAGFAALYAVLAGCFSLVRRRALSGRT